MKNKYYVVWVGYTPGIYTSWDDCREQISGFPNAKYKGYEKKEEAIMAYRGDPGSQIGLLQSIIGRQQTCVTDISSFPEIHKNAIAVDAACSRNPGPVEYRGVKVATGEELFRVGPLPGGTNNIGEYLALVHALALLDKMGDKITPVYADSRTSLAWLRNHGSRTKLSADAGNAEIMKLLNRADVWVKNHPIIENPVLKWNTSLWGEIPADFGRKK